MLFHRSVGKNIGYAKENASPWEIENAAKAANIHEFMKVYRKNITPLSVREE
ncbi:hypothetical protein O6R16_04065 [Candidatus Rickettsia tasmanensis]